MPSAITPSSSTSTKKYGLKLTVFSNSTIDTISYRTEYDDYTEADLVSLKDICEKVSKGMAHNLVLHCGNETHYFGKEMLNRSVLTLRSKDVCDKKDKIVVDD
jgi:hypothetical protein